MSVIKELKENNNASLIDLFEVLFPNAKTKYYTLFLKLMNEELLSRLENNKETKEFILSYCSDKTVSGDKLDGISTDKLMVLNYFLMLFNNECSMDVDTLRDFISYNEKNAIEKNDISAYKSYSEITEQVSIASIKEIAKELEKQTKVIHDDGEWLVIKPLSHDAAVKYGYGTKWCTAMERDSSYFRRYAGEGILMYCINRKTGVKVGVCREYNGELSIWGATDKRVDSFESGLPYELITSLIIDTKNNTKTNVELLKETVGDDFEKYLYGENELKHKESRKFRTLGVVEPISNDYSLPPNEYIPFEVQTESTDDDRDIEW